MSGDGAASDRVAAALDGRTRYRPDVDLLRKASSIVDFIGAALRLDDDLLPPDVVALAGQIDRDLRLLIERLSVPELRGPIAACPDCGQRFTLQGAEPAQEAWRAYCVTCRTNTLLSAIGTILELTPSMGASEEDLT
jgi:hypothetical protein